MWRVIASFQIAAIHGSAEFHFGLRRNAKFDEGILTKSWNVDFVDCGVLKYFCLMAMYFNFILILSMDQFFVQIILIFQFIFMR